MRKFSFESMEPANTDCLIAKKKGGGGRGNKRNFGHLRQKKKEKS